VTGVNPGQTNLIVQDSVSFDEFKLYYESAEKVTERRLSANRWNYSVSTAVILAIAVILSFSASHETFRFTAAMGALFLSSIAFLFCSYWIKQIDDFKALNTAKFAVLEEMAPVILFDSAGNPPSAKSFEPFRKEWQHLQAARALQPLPNRVQRTLALKSTREEYFLPHAFRILFAAIFIMTIIFALVSHGAVFGHVSPFSSVVPPTASPAASPGAK
jgi:hypothetical protein